VALFTDINKIVLTNPKFARRGCGRGVVYSISIFLRWHRVSSRRKVASNQRAIEGGVAPQKETVRAFLLWFGAERRGYHVVRSIRCKLNKHRIATTPDFEYAYIDGQIGFIQAPAAGNQPLGTPDTAAPDPTYRLARLESANKTPVSVNPDATLQQAITLMFTNDFSQLPVMTGPRDVKGMISWKGIGSRLSLKRPCAVVRDCMEPARIASIDDSLFSALAAIAEHD